MNEDQIRLFLITNRNRFPVEKIPEIQERIARMNDSQKAVAMSADYKDPTMIIILSIFFGNMGVDRFLIGDIVLGILKLITCGGLFIWVIIDWFLIMDRTKEVNYETFMQYAYSIPASPKI